MVDKNYEEENFTSSVEKLLEVSGNNICIDCNIPNTQWASKTFGIFLCFDCTSTHRSLGVNTSYVKSLNMDKWNEIEFTFMKLGGNNNFREVVKKYNLQNKESNVLYSDPVIKKYGEKLKCKVYEKLGIKEEEFNLTETKRKVEPKTNYYNRFYNPPVETKKNTFYDTLNAVSNSFISGVKEVKNKTFEYGEMIGKHVIIPSAILLKNQTSSLTSFLKPSEKKEKKLEKNFYKFEDDELDDFSKWD